MSGSKPISTSALQQQRKKFVPLGVFQLSDIAIARAKGTKLWDVEGKIYIDFGGSIGCVNEGHNPDEVITAIKA